MNRIWVSLWLGIMGAFVVLGLLAQVAKWLVELLIGSSDIAAIYGGTLGVFVVCMVLAALIAWSLARPLSEVSRAARQVAGGDLRARAHLPSRRRYGLLNQPGGEALRLLADFNAMAEALERLETERQATTASIAHELRTPLAVLQARLAALRDGLFPLDLSEVALLAQQTELLSRLVEDLRYLSLADAGKLKLMLGPCDLTALTRDAVLGFEPRARTKGINLEVVADEAQVCGDAARLRQVITNLLDNALKFTPQDGRVTVIVIAQAQEVRLLVQDTGPGLAEAVRTRVFERFYRTDDLTPGSGLGLAIVKSLVELHGGRVNVTNVPGAGAKFEVVLPAAQRPTHHEK